MTTNPLRKIWAIVHGEYSDYRVLVICEDKETAEEWLADIQSVAEPGDDYCYYSGASLQQMDFVSSGVKPFRITRHSAQIDLWDAGMESPIQYHSSTESPVTAYWEVPPRPTVRKVRPPIQNDKGGRVEVEGPTQKGVMKVLNEQILMWRAQTDKRAYWG